MVKKKRLPITIPGEFNAFPVSGVKPVDEVLVWSEPDNAQ
jgi:hypothetical protein